MDTQAHIQARVDPSLHLAAKLTAAERRLSLRDFIEIAVRGQIPDRLLRQAEAAVERNENGGEA